MQRMRQLPPWQVALQVESPQQSTSQLPASHDALHFASPAQRRAQAPLSHELSQVDRPTQLCRHLPPPQACLHAEAPWQLLVQSAPALQSWPQVPESWHARSHLPAGHSASHVLPARQRPVHAPPDVGSLHSKAQVSFCKHVPLPSIMIVDDEPPLPPLLGISTPLPLLPPLPPASPPARPSLPPIGSPPLPARGAPPRPLPPDCVGIPPRPFSAVPPSPPGSVPALAPPLPGAPPLPPALAPPVSGGLPTSSGNGPKATELSNEQPTRQAAARARDKQAMGAIRRRIVIGLSSALDFLDPGALARLRSVSPQFLESARRP